MRFQCLKAWLSWLETLHPRTIDLGLARVATVANRLGLLPHPIFTITVTGTNGKGSCVALLAQALQLAGYRVGTYTSPHLLKYNERIQVNGQPVTDAALCAAFQQIDTARGEISLTYFEFGTLAALLLMQAAQLDISVLEVGLGGRLDAVNIVDADIAIISTVALDHCEWLGTDREQIGYEKAGIFRPHKLAVCGDFAVPHSVYTVAAQLPTQLFCQNKDFHYTATATGWQFTNHLGHIKDLPLPQLPLQNAATTLQALSLLPKRFTVPAAVFAEALRTTTLPGRFQKRAGPIVTFLDVAHNPAAGAWLAQRLALENATAPLGKTHAVVGMLADKDNAGTLAPLLPYIERWHFGSLALPRGLSAENLAKALPPAVAQSSYCHPSVAKAYEQACALAAKNDKILVFGSFYTVAEVLKLLF